MKGCLYFFGKDFDDILQSMEGCAGLKYAVIDRVVALIMKLEPEEFWRLESEAYDI